MTSTRALYLFSSDESRSDTEESDYYEFSGDEGGSDIENEVEDEKNLIYEGKEEKSDKSGEIKISEDCIYLLPGSSKKKQVCRSSLVYPRDVDNCICSICFSLFDDPVILDNSSAMSEGRDQCGHVFCKACIRRAYLASPNRFTCPSCRQDSRKFRLVPNKELERMIARLDFKCPYEVKGCTWRGQFGDKGQEYKSHADGCSSRGQECKDCKVMVEWEDEGKHVSVCSEANVVCHLGIGGAKESEKNCVVIKCGMTVKRKDLKKHEAECKYRLVFCFFANEGYEWNGMAINLPDHVHDACGAHIALMRISIEAKVREIKERKRKLENTIRRFLTVKRKLGLLTEKRGLTERRG